MNRIIVKYTVYNDNWDGSYAKFLNASYTSKQDHIRGMMGYRNSDIFFSCIEHSYTSNADFNASVNIGIRTMFPISWHCKNMVLTSGT